MITTFDLITKLDTLTNHETEAGTVLRAMTERGTFQLDTVQRSLFHRLADEYGTRALVYVVTHNGDCDGSATAPGMVLIQNAQTAAQEWARQDLPNEHLADHDLWSISRAALAALTWAYTELGLVETNRRLIEVRARPAR